jgi:glycosyltransferase involved in cell wall biosynthesis
MRNIAVITPVAAGPHREYVLEAIASSVAFPLHVVVLDGPGRTPEMDKAESARVVIVDTSWPAGRSEARNIGLRVAKDAGYEWSIFLDADDLLLPTAFDDLRAAPEADLYYAEHMLDTGGQSYNHVRWDSDTQEKLMEAPTRAKLILPNVACMVRTERAARIGFDKDLSHGEHFDFFVKYMANPKATAIMLSRPLVLVRTGKSSAQFGPWVEGAKEKYATWAQVTV